MFKWSESVGAIDVPADKVVHLFRSMRDVQLALPGISAQLSSAYVCQFKKDGGICTAAVFHLHKSNLLAFYLADPPVVPSQKTDSMLDQGLNFIESMGFLMTDQDYHLLDAADQEMLWSSLPLQKGLQPQKESSAEVTQDVKPHAEKPVPQAEDAPQVEADAPVVAAKNGSVARKPTPPSDANNLNSGQDEAPAETDAGKVDDLLAAVEAMRAKRPGLRARRTPPTPEEMNRRRQQLRESVGRILASL